MDFNNFTYFSRHEFDSPDQSGSGSKMDVTFIRKLEAARYVAGTPFIINSGYRSKAHNEKVGGVISSSHPRGYAADIKVRNSKQRYKILEALLAVGFNRIGIYETFIHVDNDPAKVSNVIFFKNS